MALPYRWQRTNPTDARKQASFQDPRPAGPQTAGGTDLMEVNGRPVLFWAGALQYTSLIAASVRLSWEKQTCSVIHVRLVLSDWRSCSHHSDNVHTSVLRMCFHRRKKTGFVTLNYVHKGSHFWQRFEHEYSF